MPKEPNHTRRTMEVRQDPICGAKQKGALIGEYMVRFVIEVIFYPRACISLFLKL